MYGCKGVLSERHVAAAQPALKVKEVEHPSLFSFSTFYLQYFTYFIQFQTDLKEVFKMGY